MCLSVKDPVWELSRDLIHLKEEIGQGAFGQVRKAEVEFKNYFYNESKWPILLPGVPSVCFLKELFLCWPFSTDYSYNVKVNGKGGSTVVAVKMLKEEHTENELVGLVKEVEIMKVGWDHTLLQIKEQEILSPCKAVEVMEHWSILKKETESPVYIFHVVRIHISLRAANCLFLMSLWNIMAIN